MKEYWTQEKEDQTRHTRKIERKIRYIFPSKFLYDWDNSYLNISEGLKHNIGNYFSIGSVIDADGLVMRVDNINWEKMCIICTLINIDNEEYWKFHKNQELMWFMISADKDMTIFEEFGSLSGTTYKEYGASAQRLMYVYSLDDNPYVSFEIDG
jgi:hypothetical protein